MTIAILVASIVAAVAAVVSIALSLWWRRTRLEVKFTDSWYSTDTDIYLRVRLTNTGEKALHQVQLFGLIPKQPVEQIGAWVLMPEQHVELDFRVPRANNVERPEDGIQPIFARPIGVQARYGRRTTTVYHPASPLPNDDS
jgi:hypothetical protein